MQNKMPITLCVALIDPDGNRFEFIATVSLLSVPRVGERIALGREPANVLVVLDVTHRIDGKGPILTCRPLFELDSNSKRQHMMDMLTTAGFQEITTEVNQRADDWRVRWCRFHVHGFITVLTATS